MIAAANLIRVLYVEDDPMCASLVSEWFDRMPNVSLIGVVSTVADCLAAVRSGDVDLVLLDSHLPDGDGLNLMRRIHEIDRKPGVILFTSCLDDEFLLRSSAERVNGVIYKSGRREELEEAISCWSNGKVYHSTAYLRARERLTTSPDAYYKILSVAETRLIPLFASGHSDHEVAKLANLAWGTVRTHRKNIMKKLGLHKSHELFVWARQRGIIS